MQTLHRHCTSHRPFQISTRPFVTRGTAHRYFKQRCSAAAGSQSVESRQDALLAVDNLQKWLSQQEPSSVAKVTPKTFTSDFGERVGLCASKDVNKNEVVMEIPESVAVTSIDAEKHPLVGPIAQECSELVAITLWLMAERSSSGSSWSALLAALPEQTMSPILWEDAELQELLQGSPVQEEARTRRQQLQQQWQVLYEKHFAADSSRFDPATFNEASFLRSFCVVVAHAQYLPSAQCFALLPLASQLGRTGNGNGCSIDFDTDRGCVVVRASLGIREGREVLLDDERPSGELLLSSGSLPATNQSDFLMFAAELLPGDKYFIMKQQVLDQLGFQPKEAFPVYSDRMPNQLLAYLRLARLQDPALFAKVSFEQDVVLSQMNEYEVLQLLMGDCRERLQAYQTNLEDDVKLVQQAARQGLTTQQWLAARQRLGEKKILSDTMDAVRRRLAPIRGIPTKGGGMQDPNSDLKEIFDTIEAIPTAPKKLLDGFLSWARGEDDPDWKKKQPPR